VIGPGAPNPLRHRCAFPHLYEIRRRKDHRGVDLISDALPFGRLSVWRTEKQSE